MRSTSSTVILAVLLVAGMALAGADAYTRTYDNGDGTYTAEFHTTPVNPVDGNGGNPLTDDSARVYPNATFYHTGTIKGNNGTPLQHYSSTMFWQSGPLNDQYRAYARFNISSIPDGATINSLVFNFYVFSANRPRYQLTQISYDPPASPAATVYADIADGNVYLSDSLSTGGWHGHVLGMDALADFEEQLDNDWFGIGIWEYDTLTYNYFANAYGQDNVNKPYITVNYTPAALPNAPTPNSPANGATLNTRTPQLAVSEYSGASKYHFRVFQDTDLVSQDSTRTVPNWTVTPNLADAEYTWDCRVKAIGGWGPYFTPAWGFTIYLPQYDTFWTPLASVPPGSKGKNIKDGGCLGYSEVDNEKANDSGFVYALKGNNRYEFYRYNVEGNAWVTKESIPAIGRAGKKKAVKKGSAMAGRTRRDGEDAVPHVYAAKGNNSVEFWAYQPDSAKYPWQQKADVPLGAKALKEGTGAVTVKQGDTTWVYLLKGAGNTEFYRYNTETNTWQTLANAPLGTSGKPFKNGSAITVNEDGTTIYALKGSYNEFFAYNVDSNRWETKTSLPLVGSTGKKKKVKDGASLACHDDYVYALKGGNTLEFWKYQCDSDRWTQGKDLPVGGGKRVKGGGAMVYAGKTNGLYALRGNNTLDFYRYGLPSGLFGVEPALPQAQTSGLGTPHSAIRIAPNPFSGRTSVSYTLPKSGNVTLELYDVTGARVMTLSRSHVAAGAHTTHLDATRLARGIYLLKLTGEGITGTNKLIIE